MQGKTKKSFVLIFALLLHCLNFFFFENQMQYFQFFFFILFLYFWKLESLIVNLISVNYSIMWYLKKKCPGFHFLPIFLNALSFENWGFLDHCHFKTRIEGNIHFFNQDVSKMSTFHTPIFWKKYFNIYFSYLNMEKLI